MDQDYFFSLDKPQQAVYERGHLDGIRLCVRYGILGIVIALVFICLHSRWKQKEIYAEAYQTGYEHGFDQCYGQMEERAEENGVYIDYSDLEREYFE